MVPTLASHFSAISRPRAAIRRKPSSNGSTSAQGLWLQVFWHIYSGLLEHPRLQKGNTSHHGSRILAHTVAKDLATPVNQHRCLRTSTLNSKETLNL